MNQLDLKPNWYQTKPGIILLLILFFPAGLFLMWKYANWSKKTKSIITAVLAILFLMVIVSDSPESSNSATQQNQTNQQTPTQSIVQINTPTPVPTKQELIEIQFSAWDGSHIRLTKLIKDSLNDPKSYEHLETKYWEFDDYIVVATEFTAKNAFGGTVRNVAKSKFYFDGRVEDLEIY